MRTYTAREQRAMRDQIATLQHEVIQLRAFCFKPIQFIGYEKYEQLREYPQFVLAIQYSHTGRRPDELGCTPTYRYCAQP